MYSWEIKKLLELKEYIISSNEYAYILNTSPQISGVEYKAFEDTFYLWTDDNYTLKFKIKKEN